MPFAAAPNRGLPLLIGVINCFNQSKSGDGLMKRSLVRPISLFGVVAAVLSLTVVVTLSRVTVSSDGVGKLKCYDVRGIEKAC
jgi:uncharacterized membrane protein